MITFFKPNKNQSGSLVNFSVAAGQPSNPEKEFKEGCVYCKVVKQTAWNEKTHTGSFKGGDSLNVKLNMIELGKMIATMESKIPFSTYHTGYDQNVGINFSVWRDKETKEEKGYGLIFSVAKGGEKNKFAVGFQPGEDVVLKKFCELAIEHIMMANYAEEKRRIKKSFANKNKTEPAAESTQENNELEDDSVFGEE